jgi:hypothetical protein
MNVQAYPQTHFMTPNKPAANLQQAHAEMIDMQERFTGPIPLRLERPVAEILAERLAESGPDSTPPVFIP